MTDNSHVPKQPLPSLAVAAIGVVFGDIGTSPLYSLKEAFSPSHGIPLTESSILGVISLLFWAIIVVVSIKYVMFVMRADNNGEGGVLALMALSLRSFDTRSRAAGLLMMLGIFGACMFYGDAVITPAISVMSAVEGLELAAPKLSHLVLPLTMVILVLLFWIQRHGTAMVGRLFGPIMVLWFVTLAVLGLLHIVQAPEVIKALNPYYAFSFMSAHLLQAYVVLGSVVLVLTGAEALYADMGHFGAAPIRCAWYSLVMPSLVLNYFGQGALLMHDPKAIENPFYLLAPDWALLPLVVLSTVATVIASQAVISGAYSLTSQAIQLGYVPRMKILHTSELAIGQIYVPVVNWMLLFIILCIVIAFKSSDNLAAAYGIAVTATMVITTILASVVMVKVWNWNKGVVALIIGALLIVDLGFFGANLLKVAEGGWLPLGIGALLFFLLMTWFKGRMIVKERTAADGIPLMPFVQGLLAHPPHRVSGTAIYLTGSATLVPVSLLHNLKHNKVLHERTIFLTFITRDIPYVEDKDRLTVKDVSGGLFLVKAAYGFNETPDVKAVLEQISVSHDMSFELMDTSFFLARETVVPTQLPGMSVWRERVFAWMHQNAAKPTDFFSIPANRVVELGTKIEI
ncbi:MULTISPECIES: potassium transporter Kup [Paraburkholderia]|jgi:KUP system potassium uptake protein|uniref:Probable potassium transport system protein Kup n=1 Tax=Paraburkholderia largidicola TaxID=3014751 RepID=A0A7I8BHK1_9BURK|nr:MULTISPECIES: potassium transporter Kup [Paraburkholderia]BEU21056.1 potassium transporter Kup [Paraburkholderia sp. 22B1P]GJH34679.1 KUP/HAK/KT family potassium transporter [Paraburkholderia hospita]CAG9267443.1 K(+):H(+) symporter Kup [Paraburkholderia caribensis]BCF88132.1 putative potassium transport system protein kup [Paraburkholderia sp. PGU16]GJH00857.1 KUP/HAK/KT family potassium transporter [Paraburkholderia terrae]